MAGGLSTRVAVAAVGIPLAVGAVYLGGWVLVAVVALLAVVGTSEFYALGVRAGAAPLRVPGYAAAVLFPVLAYLVTAPGGGLDPLWAIAAAALWGMATLGYAVLAAPASAFAAIPITVFGPLYASALLAFLLPLRHGGTDRTALAATVLVLFPIVTTWLCDSFAMAGGATFGGPKLAPRVSPKKTWSGAVSGFVGAVLVAWAYAAFVLPVFDVSVPLVVALAIGVIVGALGQLGDLAESVFKRSVDVKDSGAFFPGHGGVLDRLDSLYWVIPLSCLSLFMVGVL